MDQFKNRKENGELVNMPGYFWFPTDKTDLVELSFERRVAILQQAGIYTAVADANDTDLHCTLDNNNVPTHVRLKEALSLAPTHLGPSGDEAWSRRPLLVDPSIATTSMITVTPARGVYPYLTERQSGGGYTITFPDVPEAISQADTLEACHEMATDALLTAFSFYIERGQPVPESKPHQPFDRVTYVRLSASTQLKIKLLVALGYDEDDENNILRCARQLGISRDAMYYHIGDLHQTTSVAKLILLMEKAGVAP